MFYSRVKVFLTTYLILTLTTRASIAMDKSLDMLEKEMLTDCLLELNMSELLRLQRSLDRLPEPNENEDLKGNSGKVNSTAGDASVCDVSRKSENATCASPQALPLTAKKRGYEHHPWQPEEKPSKLQTLFHITITSLAFLSFGGYLLCLIVQAIKSKGTTYLHPVASTAATETNGVVKRIKIYRRSRRRVRPRTEIQRVRSYEVENHAYMAYY